MGSPGKLYYVTIESVSNGRNSEPATFNARLGLPPKPTFLQLTASDEIGEMIADVGSVDEDVDGYEMILVPQSNSDFETKTYRFNMTSETMTTIKVGGLVPGERYKASVTSYIDDVNSEMISYLGVVAPHPVTNLTKLVTTATTVAMEFVRPEGLVDTLKVIVKMNNSDVAFDSKTLKPTMDDDILQVSFDDPMLIPGGDYVARITTLSFNQRNAKSFEFPFTMKSAPSIDDVIINATDVTMNIEVPMDDDFNFDEVKFALVEGSGLVRRKRIQ